MEEKKVLLSVKDLEVEFRVRGRILTAIRGISLDIYENESIAIVGESAAGKSVFTKTFAGMLDDNGYVSNGSIVFNDPELAETTVPNTPEVKARIKSIHAKLNAASRYENGAAIYRRINELKQDRIRRSTLSEAEAEQLDTRIEDLRFRRAETYNLKLTIDPSKEKDRLKELSHSIKQRRCVQHSVQDRNGSAYRSVQRGMCSARFRRQNCAQRDYRKRNLSVRRQIQCCKTHQGD